MNARLLVSVPGPTGAVHHAGERVTLVESEIFCDVDVAGRREVLPLEDLRRTCEVPGCDRRAEYIAPGDWCKEHWTEWWETGLAGHEDADWMRDDRKRPPPVWAVLRDLVLEDGTSWTAGTPLRVHGRSLMVLVRVEGEEIPFQLHREQLSIECIVPGCGCEAARWTPRYLCASDWDRWATGKLDLDTLPKDAEL